MHETRRLSRLFAAAVGALGAVVLVASPASAHVGNETLGFDSGFLHPLTGLDHLLAMVAVGVVAATWRRDRALWLAPAAFLLGMVTGGLVGMIGMPFPGAEVLIVASVILLGVAIAAAVTDDRGAAWVLPVLAFAGLAHGHAHGAEAPVSAHPVLYVIGFLLATACVHAAGVGVGSLVRDRRLVRVSMGVATASAGVLLLTGA
ncbi:HupE/UreJ family protein [Aquihabitans daechungensis]|uniref:HupE/UreJ family protein n=1 Tax=Aquihabitans daechungensis TaxID=1052257 RepID=UPI003BA09DB4